MVGTGAALTGFASAQAPAPVVTVIPPAMQQPITANGGNSANSNNNYQAQMLPGNVANPTPGTFVVRLNGQLWSEFFLGGGSGFVGSGPPVRDVGRARPGARRPGTAVFLGTGTNAGQKLAPYSIGTYFRLYPGVDAMATNGLRYGAQTEIRENFIAAQSNTGNTGTSGLTSGQTLYVRRAFWYVAGDNWGLIRMGQSDGVTGIFDNGITTGQQPGQGLWNGDAPGIVAGNGPTYPWFTQQGAEYGSPRSSTCRRSSTASTSASTTHRTTVTRNSRVAGGSRNTQPVVHDHAAGRRPLQRPVCRRRPLSGHVRAGRAVCLRRLSRQRPRPVSGRPDWPRGAHAGRRPVAGAGQPVQRAVREHQRRVRRRGRHLCRVHRQCRLAGRAVQRRHGA